MLNPAYVMIIAGEPSGDLHGANLVKAMNRFDGLTIFGIGGDAMEAQGVELVYHIRNLSVMGLTEVFSKISNILEALKIANKTIEERNPDLLILIDFPGFNLRAAKMANAMGIPVLYYISPKIWASRKGRIRKIRKRISHMAVILPFEEAFYARYKIPVTYVGNPLLDTKLLEFQPEKHPGEKDFTTIGLLPGSREKEITALLPVMMETAIHLARKNPKWEFLISQASSIDSILLEKMVSPYRDAFRFEIVRGEVHEVFRRADFLIAASGTVTLEAAIVGIPMVVIYKLSTLSYWIIKMFIRVKHICLVNLIAGKSVVPELIQKKAQPENIAQTVNDILHDPEKLCRMRDDLSDVKKQIGGPGASERVANLAMRVMEE
ncbi:MAG: lipid-A-disaccharide synthase [Desulfobacteraceae bacterium]|nr:lipid-A-disaccharide synthase [Desulfobacteraceae bacterium]